MKASLFCLAIFLTLSHAAIAIETLHFTCPGNDNSTILFELDRATNQLSLFSYFDGRNFWLAKTIMVEDLKYIVNMCCAETAPLSEQSIGSLEFTLPRNGHTDYPAGLSLEVVIKCSDGDATKNLKFLRCESFSTFFVMASPWKGRGHPVTA